MASPSIPPFPDDVATAPLLSISLSKLLRGESAEEARLWDAACTVGFFYLDLRVGDDERSRSITTGEQMVQDVSRMYDVAKEVFDRPVEEKSQYDFAHKNSYFGYKGYGAGLIDAAGNRDRNEFYNISVSTLLNVPSLTPPLPTLPVLDNHKDILSSFAISAHNIISSTILPILSGHLGLEPEALSNLHRRSAPNADQIRFIKAPPQKADDARAALGEHTDFGSVTVLFAEIGGLQVLLPPDTQAENRSDSLPAEKNWAYVRPQPGHAIINIGDALVYFSAGILKSATHRVVTPPGEQSGCTKYSVVYFCRPEDEVVLEPLQSEMLQQRVEEGRWKVKERETSKDWVLRRALGRRGTRPWKESGGTENLRS